MSTLPLSQFFQSSNVVIPPEGPKGLRVVCDFNVNTTYDLEALLAIELNRISFFQGVYIDAYDSVNDVVLFNRDTQQRVIAPAGSQGYYPIICTNPPRLTISGFGAVIPMIFYNVPISAANWKAYPTFPEAPAPIETICEEYLGGLRGYTAYANATDIFEIVAGSKPFCLTQPILNVARSTTATLYDLYWGVRSVPHTGGTFATLVPNPVRGDVYNATPFDGSVKVYTSAPTVNGVMLNVGFRQAITTTGSNASSIVNSEPYNKSFVNQLWVQPGQSFVLRHTGVALPTGYNADLSYSIKTME